MFKTTKEIKMKTHISFWFRNLENTCDLEYNFSIDMGTKQITIKKVEDFNYPFKLGIYCNCIIYKYVQIIQYISI